MTDYSAQLAEALHPVWDDLATVDLPDDARQAVTLAIGQAAQCGFRAGVQATALEVYAHANRRGENPPLLHLDIEPLTLDDINGGTSA